MNKQNKYKAISLFSGAMGLDIGLEKSGIEVAIGQDFDTDCVNTIKANGYQVMAGNIQKIQPQDLLDATGMKPGEPFLICGGPPCQPFSTAGKRLGINDPRGSLFMDFIRMIDFIRPRFFVMENVKGLISAPLKGAAAEKFSTKDDQLKTVLDVVLNEFSKLKYSTVYGVLDAVNYGVPEFRERFILIGSRDQEDLFLPFPTHFQKHQSPAHRWNTLFNAIGDIEEENPKDCVRFSTERAKFLEMIPEGGNWHDLPPELIPQALGGAYLSGGGKVGFYRRLSYSQPSPTLVTSPVQKATMMCHPKKTRPLSVREYARIQQFPDSWKLTGSLQSQYKQIGNAVPIGLGFAIGQTLISIAEKNALVKTKRTRGTNIHNKMTEAMVMGETYAN